MSDKSPMGFMNGLATSPARWLQQSVLLPRLPRPLSWRETMADWTFIVLRFLARYGFIVASIVGGNLFGIGGVVYGSLVGGILGFWLRFSLGLKSGDPTKGFFIRMHERAYGSRPRFLELLVELLRGNKLTAEKCQRLVVAYDEVRHHLQTCDSDMERNRVIRRFERDIFTAMYGSQAFPETGSQMEATETSNTRVDA